MRTKLLFSIFIVFLLTFTGAASTYELYVTNKGTYLKQSSEPFQEATFYPNAYYLKAGNMLYHLERQEWRFPMVTDLSKKMKPRLSIISQDLMVERVEIRDINNCVYTLHSLETLYSGKEKMKGWVESQSMAAYHPNYTGAVRKLHNHAEIQPTYLGDKIISMLRVYDRYSGGAHGVNNYELHTYTLSGKEIKIKDLFDDWLNVKHALKFSLMKKWMTGEVKISRQLYGEGKKELTEKLLTMTNMSGELLEILENDLSDKGFVFTLSEEGVRFNLYFPRYSLGPNPLGGSWLSTPVKEMPEILQDGLGKWLNDYTQSGVPQELPYFNQKTQYYNIFPKPQKFSEEFVIGMQKVKDKSGCLGKLWRIIPDGEKG